MSLVSNLFILFVAASVLIYYLVPRRFQWIVLLAFSYIYYIAGGPRYVVFILFSTIVTWLLALLIEKTEGNGNHKGAKKLLILGLILNFGMLGVVKYTNFTIENINALFHLHLRGIELLFPLGISFYTFQSSGYLLDVYWKRCKAERQPFKYALFLIFPRFYRDLLVDTVVWQTSFMQSTNLKVRILSEGLNEFSGAFLRR